MEILFSQALINLGVFACAFLCLAVPRLCLCPTTQAERDGAEIKSKLQSHGEDFKNLNKKIDDLGHGVTLLQKTISEKVITQPHLSQPSHCGAERCE